MLISIITINYNNIEGLKKTMASVINQSYKEFEYIVIDGGSNDESAKYIEEHKDQLSFWVSEPDQGIYNAMNKGINKSTGDYVLFLNSGDAFYDNEILEKASKSLSGSFDIYYGNLEFCFSDKKQERTYPDQLSFGYFYEKTLPHPATFIKRNLFESVFYYNEKLKIVSDWEFFICAICKNDASYKHINLTISKFDCTGISSSKKHKVLKIKERRDCLEKHFPLLIEDYDELFEVKPYMELDRFKLLKALESSKTGRKINSILLKIMHKLFK